jgi:hypothetical protein
VEIQVDKVYVYYEQCNNKRISKFCQIKRNKAAKITFSSSRNMGEGDDKKRKEEDRKE